jgi:hypothetical protein
MNAYNYKGYYRHDIHAICVICLFIIVFVSKNVFLFICYLFFNMYIYPQNIY